MLLPDTEVTIIEALGAPAFKWINKDPPNGDYFEGAVLSTAGLRDVSR